MESELARLFVIVGGLIVLVLTAALVAPFFVDWGNWKADFEREASRILGRQVTVRGSATARLLPFPSVTFSDVTVAGPTPGSTAMTIESFSMDAELAPFLSGEVLIFDMRIVKPVAVVSIGDDGVLDWTVRPSTPFAPEQVRLENVTITEGKVTLRHEGARDRELTEINATVSARALTGPWRADGSLRIDGMKTALGISTGSRDENGRLRLRLRADPERYAFQIEADGDVFLTDGAPRYDGTFRLVERPMPGTAQAEPQPGQPPRVPAYRVSGRFALAHDGLDVPEFRLETGAAQDPYTADGHARITLGAAPQFHVVADGAQIRLAGQETPDGSLALGQRLAALKEALLNLPRPEIPGTVEMNLPAIVAGDTTVRDVRLSAVPSAEGWTIGTLSAALPGRTTLESSGELTVDDARFGFKGKLLLAVGQPSGFAAWISRDVDEAIRRLPAAGFSADVELTDARQAFDNLELVLGDARFTGRAVSDRPANVAPSMVLELDGGRLDVDGLSAFASLFVTDQGTRRLQDYRLDLAVKAGPVAVAGVTAEAVDTALRLKEGVLEIDRLAISGLEGASLSATGTVGGIGGALSGKLDATLVAGDASQLVQLLAAQFPQNATLAAFAGRTERFPGLLTETEANAVLDIAAGGGAERNFLLNANGTAGGSHFTLAVSGQGDIARLDAAQLKANLKVENDEPAAIYALYGLPALPFGFATPVRSELALEGRLDEGAATRFSFTADDFSAAFDGTAGIGPDGFFADGAGKIDTGDIEPWLMTAGFSLPGMGLGMPVGIEAGLSLKEALVVMSDLKGKIFGGEVAGDLNAQLRDGRPHLTGSLVLDELDIPLVLEPLLGEAALAGDGTGWPDTPFLPTPAPTFTTDIDLVVDRLIAGGGVTLSDAKLSMRASADGLHISELRAGFAGGTLAGFAELRNTGGTALLSSQLKLDDAPIHQLLPASGLAGTADFGIHATSSGKSIDALVAALAGSATISARDLVVPRINPTVFADILARADQDGTEVDAARTGIFAPPLVQSGHFAAGEAEIALTLANGVLRAPPVRLEGKGAALTAEVHADARAMSYGASGTIEYAPGDDAIVGAEPTLRYTAEVGGDGLVTSLDTQPLAQFLTQRALEREQARVEAMQALLLERQRLRREARYYAALTEERAEAERRRIEEEARRQAEEEARKAAEEQARVAAEEEARRAAEAEAARIAAEEAKAAEQARRDAEAARSGNQSNPPDERIERQPLDLPPAARDAFNPDSIERLLRSMQ